jgi:hypothetical protein
METCCCALPYDPGSLACKFCVVYLLLRIKTLQTPPGACSMLLHGSHVMLLCIAAAAAAVCCGLQVHTQRPAHHQPWHTVRGMAVPAQA